MSKKNWARGVWGLAAVMAGSVAIAGLPQQNSSDSGQAGQATGAIQRSDDASPNRGNAPARGNARAAHMDVDRFVVKVLIQANKDEIATARLAQQRSSNEDVKKLAMQMVDDHTRFLSRLQQFQGEQPGRQTPGTSRRGVNNLNNGTLNNGTRGNGTQGENNTPGDNTARGTPSQIQSGTTSQPSAVGQSNSTSDTANDHNATGQRVNGTTSQPNAVGQLNAPGSVDERGVAGQHFARQMGHAGMGAHAAANHFVKIMEEVAQQTQQSLTRELSQKEGVQFDRCYLHAQIFGHTWMVDALTVFEQNTTSSELQPILQEGLQTPQQHLPHAKALLARIDQQVKTTASR
jgi:predicted outer membrane protein